MTFALRFVPALRSKMPIAPTNLTLSVPGGDIMCVFAFESVVCLVIPHEPHTHNLNHIFNLKCLLQELIICTWLKKEREKKEEVM